MEIKEIFKEMNQEKIEYCKFKGNDHLEKSIAGKKDFDLLVNKKDREKLHILLHKKGFKRLNSSLRKSYIGTENFIFYDVDNDKTHQFHIHYDIIFGGYLSNNYYLRDSKLWLKNAKEHPKYKVKIVTPELELIFVVLRCTIRNKSIREHLKNIWEKVKNEDSYLNYLTKLFKQSNAIRKEEKQKLSYLTKKIERNVFNNILEKNFKNEKKLINDFLEFYQKQKLTHLNLSFFSLKANKILKNRLRFSKKESKWKKEMRRKEKKRGNSIRSLTSGGMIISIIGADGSGKSTLSKDLKNWITKRGKFSSEVMHLGQKKNIITKLLKFLTFITLKLKLKNLSQLIKGYRYLIIAKYRLREVRECEMLSQKGKIVITDRYPLPEFWEGEYPMDSPRLNKENLCYQEEKKQYHKIKKIQPDIIITLNVTLEKAVERKPKEHKNPKMISIISKKIKTAKRTNRLDNSVQVDATRDYEEVLRKCKKIIWENM